MKRSYETDVNPFHITNSILTAQSINDLINIYEINCKVLDLSLTVVLIERTSENMIEQDPCPYYIKLLIPIIIRCLWETYDYNLMILTQAFYRMNLFNGELADALIYEICHKINMFSARDLRIIIQILKNTNYFNENVKMKVQERVQDFNEDELKIIANVYMLHK